MTGPRGLLAASLRVDAAASQAVDATIDRRGSVQTCFAVSALMNKTLIDAALIRFHRAKVCFSEFGLLHNQRGDNVVARRGCTRPVSYTHLTLPTILRV